MKRTYARALTRLYAPAWRRQYGDEFEALLADLPVTPALVSDVLAQAAVSRRQLLATIAAIVLALSVASAQRIRGDANHVAQTGTSHSGALPACRSYSSVAQSGVVVRRQCLD